MKKIYLLYLSPCSWGAVCLTSQFSITTTDKRRANGTGKGKICTGLLLGNTRTGRSGSSCTTSTASSMEILFIGMKMGKKYFAKVKKNEVSWP